MPPARFLRMRDKGVSPVIAVILLLAITVVLATTVYFVVSSVGIGPGQTPVYIGAITSKTDGEWSINIVSVSPSDVSTSRVKFAVTDINGSVLLPATPLYDLQAYHDSEPVGTINSGDYIRLSVATYPSGSRVSFITEEQLIYEKELMG